jgi:myo-inositol-1(or 4)-monophosphatase
LDGTTNFAHGVPIFAVSIAVTHLGIAVAGVIYNPVSRELFRAECESGAFLNDKKIAVSAVSSISHSLVATGFPYDMRDDGDNNVRDFGRVVREVQGIRRMGVASLDLAYVACGRFDGFWEPGLAPWDMAAGWVLVREAGGIVTDYSGGEFRLDDRQIVASNGVIHSELLRLLSTNSCCLEE